jgi:hypothetical protein
MDHELDTTDGQVSFANSRTDAWHRFGQSVGHAITAATGSGIAPISTSLPSTAMMLICPWPGRAGICGWNVLWGHTVLLSAPCQLPALRWYGSQSARCGIRAARACRRQRPVAGEPAADQQHGRPGGVEPRFWFPQGWRRSAASSRPARSSPSAAATLRGAAYAPALGLPPSGDVMRRFAPDRCAPCG